MTTQLLNVQSLVESGADQLDDYSVALIPPGDQFLEAAHTHGRKFQELVDIRRELALIKTDSDNRMRMTEPGFGYVDADIYDDGKDEVDLTEEGAELVAHLKQMHREVFGLIDAIAVEMFRRGVFSLKNATNLQRGGSRHSIARIYHPYEKYSRRRDEPVAFAPRLAPHKDGRLMDAVVQIDSGLALNVGVRKSNPFWLLPLDAIAITAGEETETLSGGRIEAMPHGTLQWTDKSRMMFLFPQSGISSVVSRQLADLSRTPEI